jgi:cyclopropane fatty-acyl-phospholipid synthase-like methyltransferase
MPSKAQKTARKKSSMAATADRHRLYEQAVQCAEAEIDFVDEAFARLRGRKARILREDFCGTANVCCEWVRRGGKRQAFGIDLDGEVLEWGRANNLAALTDRQRDRVTLLQEDVLSARTPRPDVVSAMNFSYWLLQDRQQLKRYFKRVRQALADDGVFFLDAYGGYDSHREITEERAIDDGGKGFTYIWEQAGFDPVTHRMACHIHFAFPDGSRMRRAFSYVWRLWTLPEIRDLLSEAGFSKVTTYWQGWTRSGEADGDFKPVTSAAPDAGWICYLSAEK